MKVLIKSGASGDPIYHYPGHGNEPVCENVRQSGKNWQPKNSGVLPNHRLCKSCINQIMDRGYVGIGIHNGKYEVNFGSLIRSASVFNADFVFTVGNRYHGQHSSVGHDDHIPCFNFQSLSELDLFKGKIVGVETERTATDLTHFVHPERAIYVLGAEDDGIPEDELAECDTVVSINTEYSLNVSNAGSIVLYDRHAKL